MMANETKVINLKNTPKKWMKLMLYFQNTPGMVFRCVCPDRETARKYVHCMESAVRCQPGWFTLLVCHRGNDIWVIRSDKAEKVVIQVD